jgi:hypothetical protein
MRPEQFIAGLKTSVHDSAIIGTLTMLDSPSGRQPPPRLVALSRWYHSLAPDDRAYLEQALAVGVHAAMFAFLSVLDGVRSVADGSGQLKLELDAVDDGKRARLNAAPGEMLHDLYQSEVFTEVFGETAA